jgi:transposase
MKGILTMSTKELDRVEVLSKVEQKLVLQSQASDILGVSVRQIKRLVRAYKKEGAQGLISKKRGRPGNHRLPAGRKECALALIRQHYPDFGPTFACEKLLEVHGLKISVGVVRGLMIADGLWIGKKVKKKRVFQLRERRSKEGELVQMDGSPHAWFEGRGPKCSLLCCIDDATGKIKAGIFAPSETVYSYFDLMQTYLKTHGRPVAVYSDKHAVFRVNRSGALKSQGVTQFGRAMKELGIEMIFANSPQAKGRVERSNRTLQDRLVKELRLHKISTIDQANTFLPKFIEDYNHRFGVVPKDPTNAHKPLLEQHNLEHIFTMQEFRQLSKDLILQYKNVLYQIRTDRESYTMRKAQVTIRERKDGSIAILYKKQQLTFTIYNTQEVQREVVDAKMLNAVIDNLQKPNEPKRVYKPSYNHPWRRGPKFSATR